MVGAFMCIAFFVLNYLLINGIIHESKKPLLMNLLIKGQFFTHCVLKEQPEYETDNPHDIQQDWKTSLTRLKTDQLAKIKSQDLKSQVIFYPKFEQLRRSGKSIFDTFSKFVDKSGDIVDFLVTLFKDLWGFASVEIQMDKKCINLNIKERIGKSMCLAKFQGTFIEWSYTWLLTKNICRFYLCKSIKLFLLYI